MEAERCVPVRHTALAKPVEVIEARNQRSGDHDRRADGVGRDSHRAQSREAGCEGHLVKPMDLTDLDKLLGELLPRTGVMGSAETRRQSWPTKTRSKRSTTR